MEQKTLPASSLNRTSPKDLLVLAPQEMQLISSRNLMEPARVFVPGWF
ncbi:MAG: hypothetical protein HGB14_12035 [Anaerolineaceae bacterium]|nr:hypothetical protein [Anaerolineaceae bacterium]